MVYHQHLSSDFWVALRKESVDRNLVVWAVVRVVSLSLSARRAWIEILFCVVFSSGANVALRKESVDRNKEQRILFLNMLLSLSARRAWIEISVKELNAHLYYRRSPQGERG